MPGVHAYAIMWTAPDGLSRAARKKLRPSKGSGGCRRRRHFTELLDIKAEAVEEPLIDGAERRLRGAHSAQREEEGKFRLSRGHTRNLPTLDQQCPDSPAPTRIHIVQPIIDFRESSTLRVVVASDHRVEVERQRCPYLRSIEVCLLRLNQHVIQRQGIEEIPSNRDRPGPRKTLT